MQQAINNLLQEAMGLDVTSIGASAVERAVRVRMQACNRPDMQAYIELAHASQAELQQLIETIVVPETWFGRDPQAFALLSRWAFESWLPENPQGTLRLLSLPCSTGEEPYSMAMALLDAGFPAERLSIDAIDISERSLALARRAIYGRNSFRGTELTFRSRHFDATAAGWQLRVATQAPVHFQQGNLFADNFLPGSELYDAIFCRNILIYFDRANQDRAIAVLQRLLARKGIAFVGPSESNVMLSRGFAAIKAPLAFAFRKSDTAASAKKRILKMATPAAMRLPAHRRTPTPVPVEPIARVQSDGLESAVELADAGRFIEAAALCAELIKKARPSARAFRLMAMIRAGAGDLEAAVENYRSALYLDPNDYEALVHLGLLLDKRGDARGAAVLFRRAKRIESRTSSGTTP